jgi:D-beta-D-heptose 7-phosphate kinase/D-beta-D-heptose 1-phosphate adenosyltransferase
MVCKEQMTPKILLIGDDCIDEYMYGTVSRISIEAPIPVFEFQYSEQKPGQAANVHCNLERLGCQVTFVTGDTPCVKKRLIDLRSKHHVARLDYIKSSAPAPVDYDQLEQYDAVVISDYEHGAVPYEMVETIRKLYSGPVFVDTKKTDLARFGGCYIKINNFEYDRAKSYSDMIITTLGGDGARYQDQVYPATEPFEITDVCGAGDTFLSALTYQFVLTNNIIDAIQFANRAASITVQHIGNYWPTLEQIHGI